MNVAFAETTPRVTDDIQAYFGGDEAYREFQNYLAAFPERGDVIQGCGGLRKVRWSDPRRGKGKRGGLRIIYLYVREVRMIGILDVYDKDESADLTADQRKALGDLAHRVRDEFRTRNYAQGS